jgi:hypothetical protein
MHAWKVTHRRDLEDDLTLIALQALPPSATMQAGKHRQAAHNSVGELNS